jgi:cyclin T
MAGRVEGGSSSSSPDGGGGRWYFSRKEIEENTPSRGDGIDLKKETYLRKAYCTFLQDLGMRLKVPQVTIATAIIFCHRFFLRQSHAKNDRRIISTVCMFLAGKVEETPRPLKDVILVSYEIIHKKDNTAAQRIKQKEVYEHQKEQILIGERIVLATLAFDLNLHHPYKPLVEAIKRFKVEKHALAQVAWNFVNDGLRTSLCLQFQPHHIAAGAIFLAAKFLKVKLPDVGERVWWQEFDVTPRQLEEVSNQMLELYEQNRVPPTQASEAETNNTNNGGQNPRPAARNPGSQEEQAPPNGGTQSIGSGPGPGKSDRSVKPATAGVPKQNHSNESVEMDSVITDHNVDADTSGPARSDTADGRASSYEGPPAIKMVDKDKVKAALEKRRKSRGGEASKKKDLMDDSDLIERALEDGVELAVEDEKRRQRWSKAGNLAAKEAAVEDREPPEFVEEGEMLDDRSGGVPNNHKRKRSPGVDKSSERKHRPV